MERELPLPEGVDLETTTDILDDLNINYRIAIIGIFQNESFEEIQRSLDQSKVATLTNFWQQVYFDWFNF